MITFSVNDMTCGHCESVVTRTIKTTDPDATVHVDLKTQQVHVESDVGSEELADALTQAGYPASVCASDTH